MTRPDLEELRRLLADATPIAGLPGYHVTRCGRVLSTESNWRGYGARELSQQPNGHGYPAVRVQAPDGRRRKVLVHTVVARTFLPPRPSEVYQVRHLDGSRTNNRVENLAWGTAKENAADRELHGTTAKGERNGWHPSNRKVHVAAKLSEHDVIAIRATNKAQHSADIAAAYGVAARTIRDVLTRKSWAWLT